MLTLAGEGLQREGGAAHPPSPAPPAAASPGGSSPPRAVPLRGCASLSSAALLQFIVAAGRGLSRSGVLTSVACRT